MVEKPINWTLTSTRAFEELYPFESKFMDIRGHALHYIDEGQGSPVVMVHGNPTWSFYFRNLVTGLSKNFRAIALDHIGCGFSDRPDAGTYSYTLESRVRDLETFVDQLKITEKINLVVHDWGGMIGLAFAVRHPEKIDKIIITNTSGFFLPKEKTFPFLLRLIKYIPFFAVPALLGLNAFARGALYLAAEKKLSGKVKKGRRHSRVFKKTWKKKGKKSLRPDLMVQPPKKKNLEKRKPIPKKLIFVLFLILLALGASSFVVYRLYFAPKDPESLKAVYQKIELKHINLPEEMVRFCFDHFPDLYAALLTCNAEITLMDKEIARIDAIAKKYPEQEKIAEKERAVWEKAKINLLKGFLKIKKTVKELYVLFRVNPEQAMIQINEKNKELTELAGAALAPAQELTQKIPSEEAPPQGLIKGTLYKLKKKFL